MCIDMAVIVVIEERKKLLDTPRFRVVLEHAVMMVDKREREREKEKMIIRWCSSSEWIWTNDQRKKKRKSIGIEWG